VITVIPLSEGMMPETRTISSSQAVCVCGPTYRDLELEGHHRRVLAAAEELRQPRELREPRELGGESIIIVIIIISVVVVILLLLLLLLLLIIIIIIIIITACPHSQALTLFHSAHTRFQRRRSAFSSSSMAPACMSSSSSVVVSSPIAIVTAGVACPGKDDNPPRVSR
jgi:hypothetical protein